MARRLADQLFARRQVDDLCGHWSRSLRSKKCGRNADKSSEQKY
jgi:hypothetical protein